MCRVVALLIDSFLSPSRPLYSLSTPTSTSEGAFSDVRFFGSASFSLRFFSPPRSTRRSVPTSPTSSSFSSHSSFRFQRLFEMETNREQLLRNSLTTLVFDELFPFCWYKTTPQIALGLWTGPPEAYQFAYCMKCTTRRFDEENRLYQSHH